MTPIPMPIPVPVQNAMGGNIPFPALAMFLIILGGLLIVYYVYVILMKFTMGDYKTKREFLIDLVPFSFWIRTLAQSWKELK